MSAGYSPLPTRPSPGKSSVSHACARSSFSSQAIRATSTPPRSTTMTASTTSWQSHPASEPSKLLSRRTVARLAGVCSRGRHHVVRSPCRRRHHLQSRPRRLRLLPRFVHDARISHFCCLQFRATRSHRCPRRRAVSHRYASRFVSPRNPSHRFIPTVAVGKPVIAKAADVSSRGKAYVAVREHPTVLSLSSVFSSLTQCSRMCLVSTVCWAVSALNGVPVRVHRPGFRFQFPCHGRRHHFLCDVSHTTRTSRCLTLTSLAVASRGCPTINSAIR